MFVQKFENLVNGLGQGGVDVDLSARFARDFRVGVSLEEDFALGITVARTDAQEQETGGMGFRLQFCWFPTISRKVL